LFERKIRIFSGHETVKVHSDKNGVEFSAFGKHFSVRRSADDVTGADGVTDADDVPVYTVKGNKLKEVHIPNNQVREFPFLSSGIHCISVTPRCGSSPVSIPIQNMHGSLEIGILKWKR
jgi:hypothetical protein